MKYKIEKGDRFKCLKTFKMEDGEVAYSRGQVYISEEDGCITDNEPYTTHDMSDYDEFFEYFKPLMRDE